MKTLKKAKLISLTFIFGAKAQLKQEWTIGAAASVGLMQGLKYKGDIKTGVKGGLATLGVLMAANGLYNVVSFWDNINEAIDKED